jgi:Ribosomal protein S24e
MYKAPKESVQTFGFRTQFGGGRSTGFALIYDSQEDLKKFEVSFKIAFLACLIGLYVGLRLMCSRIIGRFELESLPRSRSLRDSRESRGRIGVRNLEERIKRRQLRRKRRARNKVFGYVILLSLYTVQSSLSCWHVWLVNTYYASVA